MLRSNLAPPHFQLVRSNPFHLRKNCLFFAAMSEPNPTVSWRIFPFTEDLRRTAFFAVAVVLCLLAVEYAFHERWLTGLAMLFLLGSLRMFWTPTWYELTTEGVLVQTPFYRVTHKWERFRIVKDDVRGLVLTPFKSDNRLESFRGLFLRLPPDDAALKQRVRKECERYLGVSEAATDNGSKEVTTEVNA